MAKDFCKYCGVVQKEESDWLFGTWTTCDKCLNFRKYLAEVKNKDNINPWFPWTIYDNPERNILREVKIKKKVIKMPRIFKYSLYLAMLVLVWKFVNRVDEIAMFLVNIFL